MSRIESHAVVCGAESNSYPTDQETESVRSVRKKNRDIRAFGSAYPIGRTCYDDDDDENSDEP